MTMPRVPKPEPPKLIQLSPGAEKATSFLARVVVFGVCVLVAAVVILVALLAFRLL